MSLKTNHALLSYLVTSEDPEHMRYVYKVKWVDSLGSSQRTISNTDSQKIIKKQQNIYVMETACIDKSQGFKT
jgi:hypothetical protein